MSDLAKEIRRKKKHGVELNNTYWGGWNDALDWCAKLIEEAES